VYALYFGRKITLESIQIPSLLLPHPVPSLLSQVFMNNKKYGVAAINTVNIINVLLG
jgi:hypothetical protein